MRAGTAAIIAALSVFAASAMAQGVVTPPVSTFKPDSSLPSVNVPEFVITGKTVVELPRAEKPTVEIDSTYFQDKTIPGVAVEMPADRAIGNQNLATFKAIPGLFARASIGHYTTANYLVSGSDLLGGFNVHAGISGNYTSGFMANTASRDFSVSAGIYKDIDSQEMVRSSNSMTFDFTRSSYSLYGGPRPSLQRSNQNVLFGVNSDMYLGELPLAFGLVFDRYSLDDYWHNTVSSLDLRASSQVQLPSGWIGFAGDFLLGNHMLNGPQSDLAAPAAVPADSAGFNRSIYDFKLHAAYGNSLMLGSFTYSLGLSYYQYRDDSLNTVAKLYPDVRANYRLDDGISFFASFEGAVRRSDLEEVVSSDRFVDGLVPLLNTQNNAIFSIGSRVEILDGLTLIPQFDITNSKYYPVFYSDSTNVSRLAYFGKAAVTSVSLAAVYRLENLTADLALRYRKGTADSLSSIPNLAPFEMNLALDYRITPQLAADAHFLLLSSRYSDLALVNKLSSSGLLDLRLSYDFKIAELPLEVFGGGNNLLDQKYFIWQGYQEFPLTLYIGLSSRIF